MKSMTPAAEELWNDFNFVSKRMHEQVDYLKTLGDRLSKGELSYGRAIELTLSQVEIFQRFADRARELNSLSK